MTVNILDRRVEWALNQNQAFIQDLLLRTVSLHYASFHLVKDDSDKASTLKDINLKSIVQLSKLVFIQDTRPCRFSTFNCKL